LQTYYTVFRETEAFGKAELNREGLYYRICIHCPQSARIHLRCALGTLDLGVCVPSAGEFIIQTRIPVKKIGEGKITFYTASEETSFYPVSEDASFLRLNLLRSCVMASHGDVIGVQRVSSKPTGQ
jgi:hypothetical protein